MHTQYTAGRRWSRRTALSVIVGVSLAAGGAIPAAAATAAAPTPTPTSAAQCQPKISASTNTELTQLFGDYGDSGAGWTGSDSAYSVPLPDGGIAWLNSDTFLGSVNEDHSRPMDSPFIHNSIVVDRGGSLTTYTGGTTTAPESLVTVPGGDEGQDWYWFGDGTVEGDHLRVMLLEFVKTGTGSFDFKFTNTAVASFSLPSMTLEGITALPQSDVEWASAIYEGNQYTYIYGVEDLGADKYAHLARVPKGELTTAPWEYLGESGWVSDATASKRILKGVSNEFSVTKFQGRYTIVTGDTTEVLSSKIVTYRSRSLEGPFTDKTVIYTTPETGGNVFTYNPKAHPELGNGHTLVVTYNVNSFDTNDVYTDVDNYRPRYVNVSAVIPNCR